MSRKLTLSDLIDKIFLMILHDDDLDPDHKILLLLKVNDVRLALRRNDKPPTDPIIDSFDKSPNLIKPRFEDGK